jgi:hypothetical protein
MYIELYYDGSNQEELGGWGIYYACLNGKHKNVLSRNLKVIAHLIKPTSRWVDWFHFARDRDQRHSTVNQRILYEPGLTS